MYSCIYFSIEFFWATDRQDVTPSPGIDALNRNNRYQRRQKITYSPAHQGCSPKEDSQSQYHVLLLTLTHNGNFNKLGSRKSEFLSFSFHFMAAAEARPITDIEGSGEYKRRIVELITREALATSVKRVQEGSNPGG